MGLTDLMTPEQQAAFGASASGAIPPAPPPPPPTPPTPPAAIPWGQASPAQVNSALAAADPQNQALAQLAATNQAARTGKPPPTLYGAAQPGGAAGLTDDQAHPLRMPNFMATAGKIVAAHDMQVASTKGLEQKGTAAEETKQALTNIGQARQEQADLNAQASAGYAGTLNKLGEERTTADTDSLRKMKAAYDKVQQASEIDPNHYMSTMSTGRRVMLSIAAGMSGMGMGLLKQGGENPIIKQIQEETDRDIAAQKSARDKAFSLAGAAREQGLNEIQAHAIAFKDKADQAKAGMDASVAANGAGLPPLEAELAKAAIDDHTGDLFLKAFGRTPAQMVGGGGPTQAQLYKRVVDMTNKAAENGVTLDPQVAWKRALEEWSPGSQEGAIAGYAKSQKGAAGNGRALGTLHQYHNAVNEADAGIGYVQKMIDMVNSGGELSPSRTGKGESLRQLAANSIATMMAVGSKPGDKEYEAAERLLPKDPNAFQFTDKDKALLNGAQAWLKEHKTQYQNTMKQLGEDPFTPAETSGDAAESAGFEKK